LLNRVPADPYTFPLLVGKKFALFWNRYEIPNAENYYYGTNNFRILQLPLVQFVLVSALSILGIAMCLWRGNKSIYIVLLFAASQIAAIVGFFVTARYRLPLVPLFIIFMCYFIFNIAKEIKKKKYKHITLWSIISIASVLFVTIPWKELDKEHDLSATYNNIGLTFHISSKDHEKAIQYFERAIIADTNFVKSYNSMGVAYYILGRKDEALKYWSKGLKINPNYGPIHQNYANYYYNEGQFEKAKQEYIISEKLQPYSYKLKKIVEAYKKE